MLACDPSVRVTLPIASGQGWAQYIFLIFLYCLVSFAFRHTRAGALRPSPAGVHVDPLSNLRLCCMGRGCSSVLMPA